MFFRHLVPSDVAKLPSQLKWNLVHPSNIVNIQRLLIESDQMDKFGDGKICELMINNNLTEIKIK